MTTPDPVLRQLAADLPVAPPTDEAELLRSAVEHRMVSQVLAAHLDGRLPLSVDSATTLAVWDLEERRLHLRFWRTITEIQERLASLGVEVAVLKGVATEARWYDELGQRTSTDVDLLLAPDATARVVDVVAELEPGHRSLPAVQRLVRRRLLQHVDLDVGGTPVDLHFDPFKIGVPILGLHHIWASTEHLVTPHGTIRVLSAEHELVLLLLHLNKDRFAYLGPFLDIDRIIRRSDIDWSRLERFVHEEGLEVPIWKSLNAVVQVLGTPTRVPVVSGPRTRSWELLWGPREQLGGHESRVQTRRAQRWLPVHVRRRPMALAREVRRQVLPHRDLLEVAGHIGAGDRYVRGLASAILRRVRHTPRG